jgi:hypothetical protein
MQSRKLASLQLRKVASHSFQGKEKCREHLESLSGNEIKPSEIKHADIADHYAFIHITSAENFFTTYRIQNSNQSHSRFQAPSTRVTLHNQTNYCRQNGHREAVKKDHNKLHWKFLKSISYGFFRVLLQMVFIFLREF